MPTLRRLCPGCRVALIASPAVRCPSCERAHNQARGSATARGLGARYQRRRPYILARDGYVCGLCGGLGADTVDHIVPRALGGTDDDANLRAAHGRCNSGRRA
jgi:5-methylcytosine-specific restriction endonuclease McrA